MGVDTSTYLGPYVICKTEKVEIVTKRRVCVNKACREAAHRMERRTQYCSECGQAIGEIDIAQIVPKVNVFALRMKMKETLTTVNPNGTFYYDEDNNVNIWISNVWVGKRKYNLEDGQQMIDITPELIQEEMLAFSNRFPLEIGMLLEAYGNAEIRWGFMQVEY